MKMKRLLLPFIWIMISTTACAENDSENTEEEGSTPETELNASANVSNVSVTGDENNYTFSVTIESPDLGCDQYADWWEVFTEDGSLMYRRILAHSHVNEQPFTRSGGTVEITKSQVVYIRAHMNNTGYGTVVFKGSVATGFNQETVTTSLASQLETAAPLPSGCAF